jgi:bifunctional oligoribonuclease and PAP phosphatase NrnA
LLTDTGSFRFSNTSRRVLEIAADLVAAGAQPAAIAEHVYDSASPQSVQLLARVLAGIRFFAGNRVATALLTQHMFEQTDTSPVDSEGFINHLRSIKTVEIAMLFREDKEGVVHVSMRSKGQVDVARFAQRHGGGGHRNAAAFRIRGNLDAVHSQFTQHAVNYLPMQYNA